MIQYSLSLVFIVLMIPAFAQQKSGLSDEHLLKEVVVGGRMMPIDSVMLRFYKTSSLSTTDDVLSRIACLSLIRRGTYAMEPVIHGFSAGQIGLTIDGMKIFGACTDKMDPVSCYVEPENLDAIDVSNESKSKNGSSLAGCIDMKLRKPSFADSARILGAVSLSRNTVARGTAASASMDYQSDQFALNSNATYRKSQNYTDGRGREVLYSGYEKLNASLATSVKLAANQIVSASYLFDREWNVGYAALPMDVGLATAQLASISYQTQLCDWNLHDVALKIYGNSISHYMDDTHRPDIPMHMDMPGFSKTAGANLSGKLSLNPSHQIDIKLDYFTTALRAEMTMYPKNEAAMFMLTLPDNLRQTAGLYVADQWELSPQFSLIANGRVEGTQSKVTSDFGKAELSVLGTGLGSEQMRWTKNVELTANYSPLSSCMFSGSFHHGERLPTANEWYGFYLFIAFDGYDHIGNAQLKAEQANTFDCSFSYTRPNLRMKTRLFSSIIQHYITSDSTSFSAMTIGAKGVRRFVNKPSASISGLDCELSYQFQKHWQLLASTKYQYGKDNKARPLPMILPLKTIVNLRYSAGSFSITGECENAAAQHHAATYMGEQPTSGYTVYNARLAYSCLIRSSFQVDWTLSCENISNEVYREHLDWGGIYRQGRNLNLTAKLVF